MSVGVFPEECLGPVLFLHILVLIIARHTFPLTRIMMNNPRFPAEYQSMQRDSSPNRPCQASKSLLFKGLYNLLFVGRVWGYTGRHSTLKPGSSSNRRKLRGTTTAINTKLPGLADQTAKPEGLGVQGGQGSWGFDLQAFALKASWSCSSEEFLVGLKGIRLVES